jgi:hypothetical protein
MEASTLSTQCSCWPGINDFIDLSREIKEVKAIVINKMLKNFLSIGI